MAWTVGSSVRRRRNRDARYLTSGHLVYATGKGLSAVRFDLARRAVMGDAVPVVEGVAMGVDGQASAAMTFTRTLVDVPGMPGAVPLRSLVP